MNRARRSRSTWSMAAVSAGAAVAGAIAVGNRYLDRWQNLAPEDVAEGDFCELENGWRIHFKVAGNGSPVVLLHGFMDTLFSWRYNVEALAATHRVIALDMPGFGCSERISEPVYSLKRIAQVLRNFLERQGIERASIVGHSLGGALAAQFTYDFPSYVDKLVLESAAVYLPLPSTWGLLSLIPPAIPRGALGLWALGSAALAGASGLVSASSGHMEADAIRQRARALRVRGTAEALVAMFESPRDSDLPAALRSIEQPTLIIWGERDWAVPISHARRLRRQLPNAKLAILSEAGHLPHEQYPDQVNRLIADFLVNGIERVNGTQS